MAEQFCVIVVFVDAQGGAEHVFRSFGGRRNINRADLQLIADMVGDNEIRKHAATAVFMHTKRMCGENGHEISFDHTYTPSEETQKLVSRYIALSPAVASEVQTQLQTCAWAYLGRVCGYLPIGHVLLINSQ
jgi:hypothetical protein